MKVVNSRLAVKAKLVSPTDRGFVLLAAEVGRWLGPLPLPDHKRNRTVTRLLALAAQLSALPTVEDATVFRGALRPPGEGARVLESRGLAPVRYDVAILIRTENLETARALQQEEPFRDVVAVLEAAGRRTYSAVASNGARIADVDHRPDDAFLFNYFYADDRETLLRVWEYTAGWFQAKTGLPNSVLLRPLDGERREHGIINHASWPGVGSFLPSLIFRPTFRKFVLANFAANGIAAQPVIYRRVLPTA